MHEASLIQQTCMNKLSRCLKVDTFDLVLLRLTKIEYAYVDLLLSELCARCGGVNGTQRGMKEFSVNSVACSERTHRSPRVAANTLPTNNNTVPEIHQTCMLERKERNLLGRSDGRSE